jgi:hypothetical protein
VAPAAGFGHNLLDMGEVVEEELFGGHEGSAIAGRSRTYGLDSIGM